jgi:hypothetical protein
MRSARGIGVIILVCAVLGGVYAAEDRARSAVLFLALALLNSLILFRRTRTARSGAAPDTKPPTPLPVDSDQAELEIVRSRGNPPILRAYRIIVDGEEVGRIKRAESRIIALRPGSHDVRLKMDWVESDSHRVSINAGERVTLRCQPYARNTGEWKGLNAT